jgi:hypothetical protein
MDKSTEWIKRKKKSNVELNGGIYGNVIGGRWNWVKL